MSKPIQLTDNEYRALRRYAQSDLAELDGKAFLASPKSLAFGTAFHQLVLEKLPVDPNAFSMIDLKYLMAMSNAVLSDDGLAACIKQSAVEVIRLWEDPATGLPLKGKLDAVVMPQARHLIDLKTTPCNNRASFIEALYAFGYDRQAAFYLSSDDRATYFEFVGVQKQEPYNVYRVAFHRSDSFIIEGKRQVDRLLGIAYQESLLPNGWRPSSWGSET